MIVVESMAHDCHAHAVAWALREKGHEPFLFFPENYPSRADITFRGGTGEAFRARYAGPSGSFVVEQDCPLTYWARRLVGPVLPGSLAPEDRTAVASESNSVLASFRALLNDCAGARAVNNLASSRRADRKPIQIRMAMDVGMSIPETIFSATKAEILAFAEQVGGKVIFKTNTPLIWKDSRATGETNYMAYSSILTTEEIASSESIELCSGIYQKPVAKAYETRLVVMGATMFATKILSQETDGATVDWRAAQRFVRNEVVQIPDGIREKAKAYMRSAGLIFGCFDFIVDEAGNWIFLECNEQGQWLWQESKCPELPLLDAFSDFLIRPSADYVYQGGAPVELTPYMRNHWKRELDTALRLNVANVTGSHVSIERDAATA